MKKIVLVKKDTELPAAQDNWIVMDGRAFAAFMKTPEGRSRRPGFAVLPGRGEDDAIIVAECGEDTVRKWRSAANREDYVRRRNARHGAVICSFPVFWTLPEDGCCGEEAFWDDGQNVEEIVERRLAREELREALRSLGAEERDLVEKLYLYEPRMTEEEYAAAAGIRRHQVSYRKQQVLKKLRRQLES